MLYNLFLVDVKVAYPLDKLYYYFINRSGSIFNTEEEVAVHHIKHLLSHPQYVLFVDEVFTYTNQMGDGNNGGKIYIGIKGMITNLLSSKVSGCFTLMGMTAATGKPVLCICILAAKSLSVTDVKVFYYRASIPYDSINIMEENMREFKALPGFPVCNFRGGVYSRFFVHVPHRTNQLRDPNWCAQVLGPTQHI